MTTDLDPATNLPALPKGWFWRIKTKKVTARGYIYKNHPVMELREKRLLGSRKLTYTYFYGHQDWFSDGSTMAGVEYAFEQDSLGDSLTIRSLSSLNSAQILWHAEALLKEYNETLEKRARAKSLAGDYPPRKLT